MASDLEQSWSLTATVRALADDRIGARDLLERALARVGAVEPDVRAWVRLDNRAAAAAPRPGPLRGVPVGVKDIIDVAGLPTGCGSSLRSGCAPATADAVVVSLLRGRGAVPLGKTVTTEFAYFEPGATRNPAHLDHTPGGSSSGSAAAVAAGMVPLALGSQTAGSLIRPAAYCGVAGLVLTTGAVATDGVVGLSPSLDSVGLLAAGAADLRTAWAALHGNLPALRRALAPIDTTDNATPRILLWRPCGPDPVDPAMDDALDRAARLLSAGGATLTRLDMDQVIAALTADHATVMAYEAARERVDELRSADALSAPLAALLRDGAAMSRVDYEAARRRIAAAAAVVAALLDHHDAVLGPAALGPAPAGIAATGSPVLSRPWQALGLPALAVPGLRDAAGMPLGVQLIGRRNDEEHLLALAIDLERRLRG